MIRIARDRLKVGVILFIIPFLCRLVEQLQITPIISFSLLIIAYPLTVLLPIGWVVMGTAISLRAKPWINGIIALLAYIMIGELTSLALIATKTPENLTALRWNDPFVFLIAYYWPIALLERLLTGKI